MPINKKYTILLLALILFFGFFQTTQAITKTIGQTATIEVTCSDIDGNLTQCNITSPISQNCSASGSSGSCSGEFTCTSAGTFEACGEAIDAMGASDQKCLDTVVCNAPPNKPNATQESWNHCSYKGKSLPILSWSEFSHPDDKSQAGYEVQIGKSASLPKDPPGQGEWREVSIIAANSYTPSHRAEEWANWMDWNANYWWVVRVKDSDGNWSDWSNIKKMDEKSPRHAYPWPDFTWEPVEPTQQETVEFNPDSSETFGGTSISSYLWSVTKGEYEFVDDTDEYSQYPLLQFSTSDNAVRLRITDSDGYYCTSLTKEIKAHLPLPEYREVPPIIWLKKTMAGVWNFFNGLFGVNNN